MNARTLDAFRTELTARGFGVGLSSPNATMAFDEAFLSGIELGDLLEMLVARREKISGSVEVVGQAIARQGYDDVVAAIAATKGVIAMLEFPSGGKDDG